MDSLSDQELALLHTKFVVPMVVGDILRGDETLDETSEYVLNTVIGDLQPDTALLCLALSAQRMAAHFDHMPVARMLRAEADRMVEDYGSLWLAKEKGLIGKNAGGKNAGVIGKDAAARALKFVPEDLEAMAHLLDALLGDMEQQRGAAARLCDLLALQAHEHMDYAEAEFGAEHESLQMQMNLAQGAPRPVTAASENVVPFPALRRHNAPS